MLLLSRSAKTRIVRKSSANTATPVGAALTAGSVPAFASS
jgi:hypothetical protein